MREVKERIRGRNPSSAICEANTEIRVMFGRKRVKNHTYPIIDGLFLAENIKFTNITLCNSSSYGQLGNGNKSNICAPVRVAEDLGRVVDIGASLYNHISAATTHLANKV